MSSLMASTDLPYPISPYVLPEKLWFDDSGTNYLVWKAHLVYLFRPHGLLGFLDGTNPPPTETVLNPSDCKMVRNQDYVTWRRTDQFLRERILGLVEDGIAQASMADDSSRGIWRHLDDKFQEHLNQIVNGSSAGAAPIANARHDRLLKEQDEYSQLRSAVQHENWIVAEQIVNNAGNTMKETGLRIAVGAGERGTVFVTNLAAQMSIESITAKDAMGNTALSIAASAGNIEATTILLDAHRDLLYIPNILGEYPVHTAAKHARRNVLVYLIDVTSDDHGPENPYAGLSRLSLLISIIQADFCDIALDLVKKYPYLARVKVPANSALVRIAQRKHVLSHAKFSIVTPADRRNNTRYSNRQARKEYPALDLVKFLCMEMKSMNMVEAEAIYHDAILIAAKLGNHEIVKVILETFPDAIYCSNPASLQNIAHVAVQNHSTEVFDLICHMSDRVHLNLDLPNVNGNNLLHLAAKLAPHDKLRLHSNAITRLQHDVKWFKAVEKVVHPICKEQLNNAGKCPTAIFIGEHAKLKKEGEQWMKNSANTFIIVAVLISTLTFAAAITVPGGNDSSTGFPLFSGMSTFVAFTWFISISFLLSIISLLTFLHISIKSYRDDDFEVKLWLLSLGWYSLSFSVYFLVISFTNVIALMFLSKLLYGFVITGLVFILIIKANVLRPISQGFGDGRIKFKFVQRVWRILVKRASQF